jgi:acetyl-CoA carboxylase biotin carboxyl carrier protein
VTKHEIQTEITGTVWKIQVTAGDAVAEEEPIMILESMKMEIPVFAPQAGVIVEILVKEGDAVSEGQTVATMT